MPVMDGWQASKIICELIKTKQIDAVPIVALTANVMKGDREKCLEAGMSIYLSKPVRKRELKDSIFQLICGTCDFSNDDTVKQPDHIDTTLPLSKYSEKDLLDAEAIENAKAILKSQFEKTISIYIENSTNYIEDIKKALAEGSINDVILPAHTLKATSRQMGAYVVANFAKDIEYQAKSYCRNRENAQQPVFATDIDSLIFYLEKALDQTQKKLKILVG